MSYNSYSPDIWVVLKFSPKDSETHYKLLGGWYGGYAYGDSWRLNSGIASFKQEGDLYMFGGSSGSVYTVHKDAERFSGYTFSVFNSFVEDGKSIDCVVEHISCEQFLKESGF